MKTIIISVLLATAPAMAAKHVINIQESAGNVLVRPLVCVTYIKGGETYTQLGDNGNQPLMILNETVTLALKHTTASRPGCEQETLTKIVEEGEGGFGFGDAKIKVTLEQGESYTTSGGCFALQTETLSIDLGREIVLNSKEAKIVKADDCAL